jgi:histidinol-phosphate aminotransferase
MPLIQRRIRQDVQSMHAYAIQDSIGMVKLDAMENPHRLPAELQEALGKRLGALALNRYPDGRVNDLRHALAAYAHMPEGCDIMLGNGSDELISLLAMACDVALDPVTGKKPVILAPLPGFVMYAMSAALQGLDFVGVPLTADFELDTKRPCWRPLPNTSPPSSIWPIPTTQRPTCGKPDAMARMVAAAGAAGGLVVIDEAYQPFSSRTYLDAIRAQPCRTYPCAVDAHLEQVWPGGGTHRLHDGSKSLIAQIDKVRPPYNISVLNYECALFALEHADVFAHRRPSCAPSARVCSTPCVRWLA